MPQYEYKVLKVPHNQQTYYCSFLACFGWQVQNIQENVDQVVNRSMSFGHTTNYGSFNSRTYFPMHTNHANTYGSSRNHGWGSQMGTTVTNVKTSLTITLFRDIAIPYRNELIAVENRFFAADKVYLARVNRANEWGNDSWPERKGVNACADEGRAILRRKSPQPAAQVAAISPAVAAVSKDQPKSQPPVPSEPATAKFKEMEVTHNVFQSGQPGIQIRLAFDISHRKGFQCRMSAYFFDMERNPLKDINQRFKTVDGNVSVGSTFTPGYDNCAYDNYILFMPYAELDQVDGERDLEFYVRVYDEVTRSFLADSESVRFHYFQNGNTKRGENISAPRTTVPSITQSMKVQKAENRKQPPPKTQTPPMVRKSTEEYITNFRKNYGWDVLTKDREVFLQGLRLAYEGKYADAQKYYKKALDLNPKEPRYWQDVSMSYLEIGKFDEVIGFLRKGLEHLPDDPSILSSLGHACIRKGDLDSANSFADQLGRLDGDIARINHLTLLAFIAEARQDYRKAIQHFDQADELRNPEARKIMSFNQERCRKLMKEKGK